MKVLVTEPLSPEGLELLKSQAEVDVRTGLDETSLCNLIADYDGLVVRSATQVTSRVIEAGRKLIVVGRAGTGVDNIDVDAATHHGVVVVNAPTGNAVAVAEHTIALMFALARNIAQADCTMKAGVWEKKRLHGIEVRGKTLGLIGLGRAGSAVAKRAQGLEMSVVAYDPFVSEESASRAGVRLVTFEQLLRTADFASFHTPLTDLTRGMLGEREIAVMKPGVRIINCARGGLIDEAALLSALESGHVAGAALDVFAVEPPLLSPLLRHPRVVATPHLGASTEEAQRNVALETAEQVASVLAGQPARYPVNAPALSPEELAALSPYLDLAERLGSLYVQLAADTAVAVSGLEVSYCGEVAETNTDVITASILRGLLAPTVEQPVNRINAPVIARERGWRVSERRDPAPENFTNLVSLGVVTRSGQRVVAGTVMRGEPHVVRIDDFWLDFVARGYFLISEHTEGPGILGQVGTMVGDARINIESVQLGRQARGGMGMMVLGLDDPVTPDLLQQMNRLPSMLSSHMVKLGT